MKKHRIRDADGERRRQVGIGKMKSLLSFVFGKQQLPTTKEVAITRQ